MTVRATSARTPRSETRHDLILASPLPAFFFDRESTVSQPPGDPRWGASLVIRVMMDQERWVGTFTAGIDGVRGVFTTPDPHRVCCVVAGLAYVVNVRDPGAGAELAIGRP